MKPRGSDSKVGRGRRVLWWLSLGVPVVLVTAAIAGLTIQALATRRDERRFPPPGRVIEVDGIGLHLLCMGEGRPTVVFEAGAGAWSFAYHDIQPRIARTTRTCAYDRAGYGWSELGRGPRDGNRMTTELHGLLAAAGETGPHILVGSSLGAHIARIYRDRYPDEVRGLVFADGAHEDQWRELPPVLSDLLEEGRSGMRVAGLMARFGILRVMKGSLGGEAVPPPVRGAYEATMVGPRWYAAMAGELAAVSGIEGRVRATAPLGDLPLVVVSAGRSLDAFAPALGDRALPPGANDDWMRLQRELAALSSNSVHLVSPEATHDIIADDPGLVIDAILRIVEVARHGGALRLSGAASPRR